MRRLNHSQTTNGGLPRLDNRNEMKQKSLRQLARELGVSASYLSQVKNGKRPASQKVLSSVKQSGKQNIFDVSISNSYNSKRNAELCSGSTGDFESLSPGSNPGSAATALPGSSIGRASGC